MILDWTSQGHALEMLFGIKRFVHCDSIVSALIHSGYPTLKIHTRPYCIVPHRYTTVVQIQNNIDQILLLWFFHNY